MLVTVLNAAPWRHLFFFPVKQKLWLGQLYDEQRKKKPGERFSKSAWQRESCLGFSATILLVAKIRRKKNLY